MEKMVKWDWVKGSWESAKLSFEKDKEYGFSWPQRNYKCSFCKKEFKSAQALGGHMNVHRRDRARMRISSPESTPPNSGNISSAKLGDHMVVGPKVAAAASTKHPLQDPPNLCRSRGKKNKVEIKSNGFNLKGSNESPAAAAALDLNLGLIQNHPKEEVADLDLELKLGYS